MSSKTPIYCKVLFPLLPFISHSLRETAPSWMDGVISVPTCPSYSCILKMTLNSGVSCNHCHFITSHVFFLTVVVSSPSSRFLCQTFSLSWRVSIKVREKWLWEEGKKKQHSTLDYSDPALISSLKMTEEKDHIWRRSLYNGLWKKMTRAHAITPPSGARTKSPKETPHKHSICSRLLKMCSVSHLLYLWCISSGALQ